MVTTRSQGPPEGLETLPLRSRVDTGSTPSPGAGAQKRTRTTAAADDSRSPKRQRQVAADPAAQAERGSTLEGLGPNSNHPSHNKGPIVQPNLRPAVVGADAATTTASAEPVAPTNVSLTQTPQDHGNPDLPDGIPEQPVNESTVTRQTDNASIPPPLSSEILQVPASQNAPTRTAPTAMPRFHTRRPPEWALARLHPSSPAPRPRSTLEKYRRDTLGRRKRVSHWPGKKASFVQAR